MKNKQIPTQVFRPKYTHILRGRNFARFLIIIGLVGLIFSSILIWSNHAYAPQPPKNVSVFKAPSSVKPAAKTIASYSVPATHPKYISIPSIGITQARIIPLGLMKNGQIATPDNIYDTGWYQNSAEPGQSGAMFIFGHVSSWTADGVFFNLKDLKTGDTIKITRGDNQTYTYRVVSTKVYPYNAVNMNEVLAPIDASKPGLNLMTCTGQVIKGTSEFNERLVVFTSLVAN